MCCKHDPLETPVLSEVFSSLVPLRWRGAQACQDAAHHTSLEVVWHRLVLLYRFIMQKNI